MQFCVMQIPILAQVLQSILLESMIMRKIFLGG